MVRKSSIPLYENYFVTEEGKVFSKTYHSKNITKELKYDSSGKSGKYLRVTLSKNCKTKRFPVHRLVAQAFIPNPENKPQVNHKDGNPKNNSVSNLEWVTQSENMKHAYKFGLQIPGKKTNLPIIKKGDRVFKIDETKAHKVWDLKLKGLKYEEIALKFNVSRAYICDIIYGRRWKHIYEVRSRESASSN